MSSSQTSTSAAPTVLRMALGIRMAALRQTAGITYEEAGKQIGASALTVRRMENGDALSLKLAYVRVLLDVYGVAPAEQEEFVQLVDEANQPGWWHHFRDVLPNWFSMFVSLEASAQLIRVYEPQHIPGLLQTEDYARSVLHAAVPPLEDADFERFVALRMERQHILTRTDPPILWALIDETSIRRTSAKPAVMRRQIEHLLDLTADDNVILQHLPHSAGFLPVHWPLHYFRFALPELPDIVYIESLSNALYLDQRPEVAEHLQVLGHMSTLAETPENTRTTLDTLRKEFS